MNVEFIFPDDVKIPIHPLERGDIRVAGNAGRYSTLDDPQRHHSIGLIPAAYSLLDDLRVLLDRPSQREMICDSVGSPPLDFFFRRPAKNQVALWSGRLLVHESRGEEMLSDVLAGAEAFWHAYAALFSDDAPLLLPDFETSIRSARSWLGLPASFSSQRPPRRRHG